MADRDLSGTAEEHPDWMNRGRGGDTGRAAIAYSPEVIGILERD